MKRLVRDSSYQILLAALLCLMNEGKPVHAQQATPSGVRPNFIFIFCDNLGYGDIEPFGSQSQRTPHLNEMAAEGRIFSHCYAASGVCTPSRAALMTGCYPPRNSMSITDGAVLRPVSRIGLHPQEWTIAEQLKQAGYATACFGKWHLGDQPEFLPTSQGFDFFRGIPYSDDMTPREGTNWPPLPLMQQSLVVQAPADRDLLAQDLTAAACKWIGDHRDQPFFLYFPQCMPGSTTTPFSSEKFRGKSKNGRWGDSIEEIDWSLGEIRKALAEHHLTENTLIVWTSDNGAPRHTPPQGSNFPLSGWGYSTQEGGMRVPCLMCWPSRIPAGTVCEEMCSMLDFLPTFASLSSSALPADLRIDGHDITSLMTGTGSQSTPYEAFYYYHLNQLQAVRSGPWKLVFATASAPTSQQSPAAASPRLYNVVTDGAELFDRAGEFPEIVSRLEQMTAKMRVRLGDGDKAGKEVRPHGIHEHPQPVLMRSSPSSVRD